MHISTYFNAFIALHFARIYSQSIRPMPRAVEQAERIIEELTSTRENIQALNEQLKQVSKS